MAGRMKRFAGRVAVTAALFGAGYVGGGRLAGYVAKKGPDVAKPAAAKISKSYTKTTAAAKAEVNSLVREYGWDAFYRAFGAACGAATMASMMGGRKRRTRSVRLGFGVYDDANQSEVGGRVRGGVTAVAAIGGAMFPTPVISVALVRAVYRTWKGLRPDQREAVIDRIRRK